MYVMQPDNKKRKIKKNNRENIHNLIEGKNRRYNSRILRAACTASSNIELHSILVDRVYDI